MCLKIIMVFLRPQIPRLLLVIIIFVLLGALAVVLMTFLTNDQYRQRNETTIASDEAVYKYASVASSTRICSQVGKLVVNTV
jgi:flagellar basal body-associated protein FliL